MNQEQKETLPASLFGGLAEKYAVRSKAFEYGEGEKVWKVNARSAIPFGARLDMIAMIVGMVFTGKANTIECYVPAFETFAKRYAAVSFFTDLQLPDDLNEVWFLLSQTSVYQDVAEFAKEDLEDIFAAADAAISARREYLTHKTDFNVFLDTLAKSAESLGEQLSSENVKGIMSALQKIPKMSTEEAVDAILKSKDGGEKE